MGRHHKTLINLKGNLNIKKKFKSGYMTLIIRRLSKYSWFKIKTQDKVIHIDPGYAGYFKNQGIPNSELKDKAELVLVTHFHKDHLQPEALFKIRKSGTVILAPEMCDERIEGEFKIVKPGDELTEDDLNIKNISVKVTHAYNTPEGNSTRKAHHKGDGVGYLVNLKGKTIYHAGDTDLIPEMQELGKVDVALLPIGGTFTMDIEEAVEAAFTIKPQIIIPMHVRDADPEHFKDRVEKIYKSDIKVIPLDPGEEYTLND